MFSAQLIALALSAVAPPQEAWKAPYEILPIPAGASSLAAKLHGKTTAVWEEGDVLTILHKEQGKSIFVTGGIQLPMKHVDGTDLWIQRLKMQGWDKAFVTYGFYAADAAVIKLHDTGMWHGVHGPSPAPEAKALQGKFLKRTIHSKFLNEDREITIYLPPNAPKFGLSALFMGDGSNEGTAKVIEPLILSHKISPIALIGVKDGGYRGDRRKPFDYKLDYRGREYVIGLDPERFKAHMDFFTREVTEYVAKEFGISTRRQDRAIFGVSNSASFAAAAIIQHPDVFREAIPMSHPQVPPGKPTPRAPVRLHYVVGTLEISYAEVKATVESLKTKGFDVSLDSFVAGHDSGMWDIALTRILPKVFPPH